MISFEYYGKIKSKGRPRHRIIKGPNAIYAQTYTDKQTQIYEEDIKMAYLNSWKGEVNKPYTDRNTELKVNIVVYMKPAKSTSKKKLEKMLAHEIHPIVKPDVDNIAKAVFDSLNGVAYADDKQIIDLHIQKFYSEQECMLIEIYEECEREKTKQDILNTLCGKKSGE